MHEKAYRTNNGRWWFSSREHTHSEESAKAIVNLCQTLDIPVNDTLTVEMLTKLTQRVVTLEEKLEHARLYGFSISAEDE
jgi:hypothetical protein